MQGRSKEIVLLVLAVGALAIGLYTFRGKPVSPPPPSEPAVAEVTEPEAAEAPEEAEASTGEDGEERASDTRNPFTAPGGAAAAPAQPAEGVPAEPAAPETSEPVPGDQPPDQAEFKLEGIMTGPPPFAVIRHGDKPYFVRVGDEVPGGYRVEAIRGEREVVLVNQHGTLVLRTGKSS